MAESAEVRGAAAVAVLVLAGCAAREEARPLTADDVIARHKAGAAPGALIQEIEVTRSVFYIGVAEVVALRDAGVPDAVIDRMLQTAWRPERVYYVYDDPWWPHRYDPYWPYHRRYGR